MTTTANPTTPTSRRSRRSRWPVLMALAVPLALLAAACGDDSDDEGDVAVDDQDATTDQDGEGEPSIADGPEIKVGAQDFPESTVLAEIYAQALEGAGFEASTQDVGGFRDLLLGAFESGDINLTAEYLASDLNFLAEDSVATGDVDASLEQLEPLLADRDLVALTPSEAANRNTFVMTAGRADDLGIASLSDLADHQDLILGAPADCEENPFCIPGLQDSYGVDLSGGFTPLAPAVIPSSLENGAIDIGVGFTTDAWLADDQFVELEDTEGLFAAENILPVASQDLVDAYGDQLTEVLDEVSSRLTTETMIELNGRHIDDREDADVVAADWLADEGLAG